MIKLVDKDDFVKMYRILKDCGANSMEFKYNEEGSYEAILKIDGVSDSIHLILPYREDMQYIMDRTVYNYET